MLNRMEQILQQMEGMTSDQLDVFLTEGSTRAAHILSREYQDDREFLIIGEEELYDEVMTCQYSLDTEP